MGESTSTIDRSSVEVCRRTRQRKRWCLRCLFQTLGYEHARVQLALRTWFLQPWWKIVRVKPNRSAALMGAFGAHVGSGAFKLDGLDRLLGFREAQLFRLEKGPYFLLHFWIVGYRITYRTLWVQTMSVQGQRKAESRYFCTLLLAPPNT